MSARQIIKKPIQA